jgi:aromatic ring-cleaving dioxygenase
MATATHTKETSTMSNAEKFAAQAQKMIARQTTGQIVEMYTLNMTRMQSLTHGSDDRNDAFRVHMWIGEILETRIGADAVEAIENAILEEVAA